MLKWEGGRKKEKTITKTWNEITAELLESEVRESSGALEITVKRRKETFSEAVSFFLFQL